MKQILTKQMIRSLMVIKQLSNKNGIFILSLVALICFINVLGFIITYFFIQRGNSENKYPKLSKIINYYKKVL